MIDLKIAPMPDYEWLSRLRPGHFAWDVKGERYVQVCFAYEPPDPGCNTGSIGLEPIWEDGGDWGSEGLEKWHIKPDGCGFDGSQLLMPLEDNCPDEPAPLPDVWQRRVERDLDLMKEQLDNLHRQILVSLDLFEVAGKAVQRLDVNQKEIARVVQILLDIT